ncbi:MAG: FecR family protein [Tannerella sp.]|jgi:hypothetical protein|nr:FecR family protein [Tannerella sp.]
MMKRRTYKDFLTDNDFIRWRLTGGEKPESFEDSSTCGNPELKVEMEKAIEEFSKIRLNRERLPDTDVKRLWRRIRETAELKRNGKKRYLQRIQYAAAACFVLIIGLSAYLLISKQEDKLPAASEHVIVGKNLEEQDIKLITKSETASFSNDINIQIDKNGTVTIKDNTGKEEKTVATEKESMHKIIVPYGKHSELELSDGTKVWVNSGSVLEFPGKFTGKTRAIKLAGEIFLEVSKDKKPFVVHTPDMEITVYGTAFNVSTYAERSNPFVVLVEGKVGVKTILSGEETIMNPNEMVSLRNNRLNKGTVDVRKYTSWKEGYLILDQTPVSQVLKYLEQYYNLSFDISENINLQDITCTGKIRLSPNLDDVMETISLLSSTKYIRENNKIYIKYQHY